MNFKAHLFNNCLQPQAPFGFTPEGQGKESLNSRDPMSKELHKNLSSQYEFNKLFT